MMFPKRIHSLQLMGPSGTSPILENEKFSP